MLKWPCRVFGDERMRITIIHQRLCDVSLFNHIGLNRRAKPLGPREQSVHHRPFVCHRMIDLKSLTNWFSVDWHRAYWLNHISDALTAHLEKTTDHFPHIHWWTVLMVRWNCCDSKIYMEFLFREGTTGIIDISFPRRPTSSITKFATVTGTGEPIAVPKTSW